MNDKPLALIEREARGWPEVWKKRDDNGPGAGCHPLQVPRPKADWAHPRQQSCRLPVSAGARDELIRSRQATLTPRFCSRTSASYRIRTPADAPGAIELFRMSYERLKESAEGRGASL
jgi:hypothetical protein